MRNFCIIILANIVLETAIPIVVVASGLTGLMIAPANWMATIPAAVQMASAAIFAAMISRLMIRYGRRFGFMVCSISMALGGIGSVMTIIAASFWGFTLCQALIGLGLLGINFFRYAAAEAATEHLKASASSLTLASGLIAVPIGGMFFAISTNLLAPVHFAGAYMIVCAIGIVGTAILLGLNMPAAEVSAVPKQQWRSELRRLFTLPAIPLVLLTTSAGHGAMLLTMMPASIAMVDSGFTPTHSAHLISLHLLAMFAPGLITGQVIQKIGFQWVICLGVGFQFMGFILGSVGGVMSLVSLAFYIPLIASGIGWNFMFLGGTHGINLIKDNSLRASVQGLNETGLAVLSTIFVLCSAPIFAFLSWPYLLLISAVIVLTLPTIGFVIERRIPS